MQLLLIFLFTVTILLVALTLIPLRIRIRYQQRNFNDLMTIEMSLWKLPPYKLAVSLINFSTSTGGAELKYDSSVKKPGYLIRTVVTTLLGIPGKKDELGSENRIFNLPFSWKKIQRVTKTQKKTFHYYWAAGKYLLNHVQCRYLKWHTKLGIEDAAVTGVATGLAWAAKTGLLSVLFKLVKPPLQRPELQVKPNFNSKELIMDLDCIFEVRLGYIMITGTKMLFIKG
ncbi:MAG: DUF2953 domain-containing protein [Desulfotomaculum sp.]|nr:DUF2953 domain-containing protein [Desulfotomaculum sp.]